MFNWKSILLLLVSTSWFVFPVTSRTFCACSEEQNKCLDFQQDFGGIPDDSSIEVCRHNTERLSDALTNHSTDRTICIVPPNTTLHFVHGVVARDVHNSVWVIDGTMQMQRDWSENPFRDNTLPIDSPGYFKGNPRPFLLLQHGSNNTITTSFHHNRDPNTPEVHGARGGLIHGNGPQWWGIPFFGYVQLREQRPVLFMANWTNGLLLEGVVFQDSPYYHVFLGQVENVEVRHVSVVSRRTSRESHSLIDLSAFNTDGIDVSGRNVWIHDVDIWAQDDCIAVKDNHKWSENFTTANMTFERIVGSGLGLVIGSIGGSVVRNITFKDSYLHQSFKGIYFKFRNCRDNCTLTGLVENIHVENVTMEAPQQWPIWIGPAQQSDSVNPCRANPCSLCWPLIPLTYCAAISSSRYHNITLRDIQINNPLKAPGVLMGHGASNLWTKSHPTIDGLVFDNVQVTYERPAFRDPRVIFPGLGYPVNDPNVMQEFWFLFVLPTCIGIGVTVLACIVACRKRGKYDSRSYASGQEEEIEMSGGLAATKELVAGKEAQTFQERLTPERGETNMLLTSKEISVQPSMIAMERRSESSIQSRCNCALFGRRLLFLFSSFVCWTCIRLAVHVLPSTHRVTEYYVCSGVKNGVATGSTWPVPHCLRDETDVSAMLHPEKDDLYYDSTLDWKACFVLTLVAGGSLIVCFWSGDDLWHVCQRWGRSNVPARLL